MLVLSAADHVVLIYWVRSPDQDGRGDLWSFSPWGCWQTSCSHSLQPRINTFGPSAMSRLRRDVPASDHVFCVPFVSP